MAIYHLTMKRVKRADGCSATAAAAYRSACLITDARTGEVHDYRRKAGVESSFIIMPTGIAQPSREDLWNRVELHHKRGDAIVAREFEVALPQELGEEDRRELAEKFAREVAEHYRVAADVNIHRPSKAGDERNHHAHILLTACTVNADGLGKKAEELDPIHCQRAKIPNPAEVWRERWATLTNEFLERRQIDSRVDHRTLAAQGIDRAPQWHHGPSITAMLRRGESIYVSQKIEEEVEERLTKAKLAGERERALEKELIILSTNIQSAKKNLAQLKLEKGAKDFEEKFEIWSEEQFQKFVNETKKKAFLEAEADKKLKENQAIQEQKLIILDEPKPSPAPSRSKSRGFEM